MSLEELASRIGASRKYRHLAPATIRDVLERESRKAGSDRDAVEASRKRLHRILAGYLGGAPPRRELDAVIAALDAQDETATERALESVMARHVSSRERLGHLGEYYRALFAITGMPTAIADLACAVNPFAFRWMGLDRTVRYHAFDNDRRMVDATNEYFAREGVGPGAKWCDVLCEPVSGHFDVAFVFKMFHCLERRRRGAGLEVLDGIRATWRAVSFPTRNMRGQRVDILGPYRESIEALAARRGWRIERVGFDNEILVMLGDGGG